MAATTPVVGGGESQANTPRREPASWSIIAGVGYSLALMAAALVLQLVVHLFVPQLALKPTLCPFYALATGRVIPAVCDTLVYAGAAYYNSSRTSKTWEETHTNELAKWTIAALAIASVVFDFTEAHPIQTRVGGFLLAAVISGAVGGALSRSS